MEIKRTSIPRNVVSCPNEYFDDIVIEATARSITEKMRGNRTLTLTPEGLKTHDPFGREKDLTLPKRVVE